MATSVDFLDYDGLKEFDAQNKINYRKAIKNEAAKITASIGNIGLLTTNNKENLVSAVNELHNKLSDNEGGSGGGGGGTNFTPQENPLEIQLTLEDDILSATIVNGSITSEKLAPQIINTEHIVDNAVTTDKIANSAITFEKLDAESVQQGLGNPIPVNANIQIVSYENYLQLIEDGLVDETTFYCIPY